MSRIASFSMCLVMICVLLLACGKKEEQEVSLEASVLPLTDEQYDKIRTSGLPNPVKDDFRKVTVHVEARHLTDSEAVIDGPEFSKWQQSIDSYDQTDRFWDGSSSDTATSYTSEIIIYSKGLSDEDIKKAFSEVAISVPAAKEDGRTRVYHVSDYFVFDYTD
ncbi:hypothetical protein DNH61_02740 [Paenibacillus sambharensis]|uniref:Uncharacterized protein n=1 Tax=Paenibacillus sambharensis TaxID=1803190 RepID=A0A2W1LGV3_9BACL|nr:hypothetical protein [Paenibacillus sambharensis]PZD97290.1 hypothetical protein DNH61_02740 [Paenibacillus sambharensis]